jgi:hypothetical protein
MNLKSAMNIPLHMLLLAGLLAPAVLPAQTADSASATAPAEPQPYAGVNLGYLSEKIRAEHAQAAIPAGIGVLVGFVDPTGPAAGKIEEGDILTRFDDQILVNASQFQSLVRLRKAGDTVKLTLVRGAEVQVAEVKLEGRIPKAFVTRPATPRAATGVVPATPTPPPGSGASGRTSITINGQPIEIDVTGGKSQAGHGQVIVIGPNNQQLPPEVLKRLEEMRARGLPIPQLDQPGLGVGGSVTVAPGGTTQSFSKSFSFSLGSTTGGSSSSMAADQDGTVSLEEKDGKKHATIKDPAGKVVFEGEVTTPDQRAVLPEEVRRRLKLVEGNGFSIPGFNGPGANPKAEGKAKGGAAPAEEKPKKKRDPKEGA